MNLNARWQVLVAFALMALVGMGYGITAVVVEDGTEKYQESEEREIAEESLLQVRLMLNPLERWITPGVRVTSVAREPGHCTGDPRELGEYRATVRTYTLFAIPAAEFEASCGVGYIARR